MDQQRALQRYEETWLAFTEELKTNPTVTLRAICKKLHTNECGMSKWASKHGYSVKKGRHPLWGCHPFYSLFRHLVGCGLSVARDFDNGGVYPLHLLCLVGYIVLFP